jgi:hypothetical protein
MEGTLRKYVDRIGWATVVLAIIAVVVIRWL